MSKFCGTSGGKGNLGMFIERDPKVCAAGKPSSQPTNSVADALQHYLLQEEAEALIRDAIHPPPKPRTLPPLRHPPEQDMRNSVTNTQVAQVINPPIKTKFQTLVEDFKESVYTSYWKKMTGHVPDPVPTLPLGLNIYTTMGKKTPDERRAYDIIMPKDPVPDITRPQNEPGYQKCRKYCESFNPNIIFGQRCDVDSRGIWAKCCLTDDDVVGGTSLKTPMNTKQAHFRDATKDQLGIPNAPNNNISCVPDGYAFGILQPPSKVAECMTTCELNPNRDLLKKCLGHLNSLRKCMSKRYDTTFFKNFYLNLRYYDNDKSGWLPKGLIYKLCNTKFIRFNPALIEPLLTLWEAFSGTHIKYETFVRVLNFSQPTPELTKIWDIPDKCIDFRTTYSEMVKPGQDAGKKQMAGLPTARYFDMDLPVTPADCCRADRTYLPEESNAMSNLCPSIFTLTNVNHRDMYAKRDPAVIRKVFEAIGDNFDDDRFEEILTNAKKYHSQGWVSFETFRRSLSEMKTEKER